MEDFFIVLKSPVFSNGKQAQLTRGKNATDWLSFLEIAWSLPPQGNGSASPGCQADDVKALGIRYRRGDLSWIMRTLGKPDTRSLSKGICYRMWWFCLWWSNTILWRSSRILAQNLGQLLKVYYAILGVAASQSSVATLTPSDKNQRRLSPPPISLGIWRFSRVVGISQKTVLSLRMLAVPLIAPTCYLVL